jgi:hypothetical protein
MDRPTKRSEIIELVHRNGLTGVNGVNIRIPLKDRAGNLYQATIQADVLARALELWMARAEVDAAMRGEQNNKEDDQPEPPKTS